MATTNNLGITLLEQAQAQKEVTINQALSVLDAASNRTVLDKDLATPPASPAAGDMYLVATGAAGAWAGKSMKLAYYDNGWRFMTPRAGLTVWVSDENAEYRYDGSAWAVVASGGGMAPAIYDPAGIAQQLVGTSAAQTLSNKTISGASNSLSVRLNADVTGNLPVTNLNSGTGASSHLLAWRWCLGNPCQRGRRCCRACFSHRYGAGAVQWVDG